MWSIVAAVACGEIAGALELPGGIVRVNRPGDVQILPRPDKPATDCEGCGAPLKAYLHHCEYCRREK